MNAYARQQVLLRLLYSSNGMSIADLAQALSVSSVTVRRDLAKLKQDGLINRDHGLVMAENRFVAPVLKRTQENELAKNAIALSAMQLIEYGSVVMIDSGSTAGALAKIIKNSNLHLTVITPSLYAAYEISNANGNNTVMMPSGTIQSDQMVLIGPDCAEYLNNSQAKISFVSTSGFRMDSGFTVITPLQIGLKRAMITSAEIRVMLADHTKFTKAGVRPFATVKDFDYLITDQEITDPKLLDQIAESGCRIIYAMS